MTVEWYAKEFFGRVSEIGIVITDSEGNEKREEMSAQDMIELALGMLDLGKMRGGYIGRDTDVVKLASQ